MKKRLLSVILSVTLGITPLLAGCGNAAGEPSVSDSQEEDEEDEDRDDDREERNTDDEKEDSTSSEPVIVKEIDPDTLIDQISVFLGQKDQWAYNDGNESSMFRMGYFLTDFDHNGRAELTVTRELDSTDVTIDKTYEINEDGDGIDIIEYVYPDSSLTKDMSPDLLLEDGMDSYYDRERSEVHYFTVAVYDNGNGDFGIMNYDFTKSGNALKFTPYLSLSVKESVDQETYESSFDYTYYSLDEKISEQEYNELMASYQGDKKTETLNLGVIVRYMDTDLYLKDMDDVELKNALYDSYMVFTGNVDPADFDSDYNPDYNGYSVANGDLFENAVGSWSLYASEVEGDVVFYDEDSPFFETMDIYEDNWVSFTGYEDGKTAYTFDSTLSEQDGLPVFIYDIVAETGKANEYGETEQKYTIMGFNYEDGETYMVVYFDTYGEDGVLAVSTLVFVKDR